MILTTFTTLPQGCDLKRLCLCSCGLDSDEEASKQPAPEHQRNHPEERCVQGGVKNEKHIDDDTEVAEGRDKAKCEKSCFFLQGFVVDDLSLINAHG